MWAQKHPLLANTANNYCQMHSYMHNSSFLKFLALLAALFLVFGTLRQVCVSWADCLKNTVGVLPYCPQLQHSTQTGAVASFISTHSRWKLCVFAATTLTADCISLVRAVGTLWLAIAAPPGWNALAVLTGKVRGRTCLLCCGGKYHIRTTTTRGFSPFSTF